VEEGRVSKPSNRPQIPTSRVFTEKSVPGKYIYDERRVRKIHLLTYGFQNRGLKNNSKEMLVHICLGCEIVPDCGAVAVKHVPRFMVTREETFTKNSKKKLRPRRVQERRNPYIRRFQNYGQNQLLRSADIGLRSFEFCGGYR
jgi:hypothetical protein